MLLIAAVYLLLAMRVRVHASVKMRGGRGNVQAEIHVFMLTLCFDRSIALGSGMLRARRKRPKPSARERISAVRRAWPYAIAVLRAVCFEHLGLDVRLGLGEACSTALAAGTAKAGVSALFSFLNPGAPCDLRIEPDFQSSCFLLSARCIFSACPGDIMFAVLKAAVKKSRKEGFGWKSIPLRA